jgi:amino acid transporter
MVAASFLNLVLSYILDQFFPSEIDTLNHYEHYGILVVITLALAYVNFRGLDVVGFAIGIIFLISITPVILMVVLGE